MSIKDLLSALFMAGLLVAARAEDGDPPAAAGLSVEPNLIVLISGLLLALELERVKTERSLRKLVNKVEPLAKKVKQDIQRFADEVGATDRFLTYRQNLQRPYPNLRNEQKKRLGQPPPYTGISETRERYAAIKGYWQGNCGSKGYTINPTPDVGAAFNLPRFAHPYAQTGQSVYSSSYVWPRPDY
ncbi:unnamed protein product [Schistocephalus solidus]|uniref:Uncharacterized protein n=1 Tax=Schistocephalus solidus TaxID=70667 RepID=A0A183T2Z7_SCHSO|nr:unnamed protein product [Schistocephalus solidus]